MPPPPPPPPPGPGPPGPPPPPMSTNMPNRQGLLGDIAKGKKLKKAVTNDRSGPTVGGGVVDSSAGGARVPSMGKPPVIPGSTNKPIMEHEGDSKPQLGGLFAAGMPTLRKTNFNSGPSESSGIAATPKVSAKIKTPPTASIVPPRAPPAMPASRPTPAPARLPTASSGIVPPLPPAVPPPVPGSYNIPSAPQHSPSRTNNVPATHASDRSLPMNPPPARPANLPPSLPSAPPPPLPSGGTPASRIIRASVAETPMPLNSAPPIFPSAQQLPPPPPPPSTTFLTPQTAPNTHSAPALGLSQASYSSSGLNVNGLQAALATRNSNSHDMHAPPRIGDMESVSGGTDYSLKPQNIKRVDDSKYKFQPESALPTIRPFTGYQKVYRSGRSSGSTVPLNLQALRS